jgi:DNA mismatch repair protein MutL
MKIRYLSQKLIKQIAAGEVIAKPYNAIKELLENSIDAQATQITIHIENGGLNLIQILDDGIGMGLEDLKICTELHTTSKTNEDDHFFGLNSLGFRGEGLASISAISNIVIESNGYKMIKKQTEEDKEYIIEPSLIEKGTKISVYDIFQSVPARAKFLKNEKTEWSLIKDTIIKYSINYSQIQWRLFHNSKKILDYAPSSRADRVQSLSQKIIQHFEDNLNSTKIECFICESNKIQEILFINNRPIKDRRIFAYLKNIFLEYFPKSESPKYVLFIDIDPYTVDFNAHPAKEEARIINYNEIFSILSSNINQNIFNQKQDHIIFETFSENNIENNIKKDISSSFEKFSPIKLNLPPQRRQYFNESTNKSTNKSTHEGIYERIYENKILDHFFTPKEEQKTDFSIKNYENIKSTYSSQWSEDIAINEDFSFISNTDIHDFRIIGQIKNTYVIFETEAGIGIFDQHAAHERIIYEEMKLNMNFQSAQSLIIPIVLNLKNKQIDLIEKGREIFLNNGFKIEKNKVLAIPSILKQDEIKEYLEKIEDCDIDIFIDRMLADVACKKALKSNTKLSQEQMESLLYSALKNPPVCNHGRPVFKYFSINEIQKWFKRLGY